MLSGFDSLPLLKDARRFVMRALGFDPDAVFVHRAGAETIGGVKTFTSKPLLPGNASQNLEPVPLQQFNAGPGGAQFSHRNLLVNGNFAVNQRGYVSGAATVGANQYTLDMWRVVVSGQSVAFTNLGGGTANFANQVTAPAGGLEQVVPGENIQGGTYTLSWVGAGTAKVNNVAVSNGVPFTLPAGLNAIVQFVGVVAYAQLEPGGTATTFEYLPFDSNLARCQHFYWRSGTQQKYGWIGIAGDLNRSWDIPLPVVMRSVPTVSTVTGGAGNTGGGLTWTADRGAIYGAYAAGNTGTAYYCTQVEASAEP